MSEKQKNRPNKKPNYNLRRATALGITALTALGAYEGATTLFSGSNSYRGPVREYTVRPGDTEWTVANEAFPSESDDAEKMYEVRQEIIDQLPRDSRHENGMLQPGDELIFGGNAKIGKVISREKEIKDAGRQIPRFTNSYLGKDGKLHFFYDKDRTIILPTPIS